MAPFGAPAVGDWAYNQHAATYILNPSMFGDLFDTS